MASSSSATPLAPWRASHTVSQFVHDVSGRDRPAGGGVVSASFLNAKPAVGGIGVEPRRGGVIRVLFTVASDAVADTVVRSRRNLRDVDPSAAVFDVLSDREEAQHRALWPAFLAAKAAGKRAQFHRARLVVDGERWRLQGFSNLLKGPLDHVCSETIEVSSWYGTSRNALQVHTFFELAALNATPGFLVHDTLVLTVDIEVQREARFALDPGCVPSDLMLKLPSGAEVSTHWHTLRTGSDVLCGSLESASLSVDGSLSAWLRIVMSPLHDAPALTLGGAYTLLPVAHQYGFTKLVTKLCDFVKGQTLLSNPQHPSNFFASWLVLAERLQLDDLLEQLLKKLCQKPDDELADALFKPIVNLKVTVMRGEVEELCSDTRNRMLALLMSHLCWRLAPDHAIAIFLANTNACLAPCL
ncbi:hypothetical protein FOA52_015424 [Chlamydomonas sp. UWO 241]|nr:hypothetical protein FOA52_015424 [Chlamydomonas sp. UWO 241]